MNYLLQASPSGYGFHCGCCNDQIYSTFGFWDTETKELVCAECRTRLRISEYIMANAGIKKCTQVSGGKPLQP